MITKIFIQGSLGCDLSLSPTLISNLEHHIHFRMFFTKKEEKKKKREVEITNEDCYKDEY